MTQDKTDQAAPELLPCPFCGYGVAEAGREPQRLNLWHVFCSECDSGGPSCETEAEAIAAWNRRADLAAPSAPAHDLRQRIYDLLRDYRQFEVHDEDGSGYPLVDALTLDGHGIDMGEREIFNIADMLAGEMQSVQAPSAPAEVEGLVERHQDKHRNLIINHASSDLERIINGHDPEEDHLGNRVWDRLDKMACEIEAHHASALTALQAENERLKKNLFVWRDRAVEEEARAEKAEAERDAWKDNADTLAEAVSPFADVGVPSDPMSRINLTADREFVIAAREALAALAKLKGDV